MTKPKIDTSKIKPGDTVTVRGVVRSRHDDGDFRVVFPVLDGNREHAEWSSYVRPSAIVSHEPTALKVGDRVRVCSTGIFGVILAQHADVSWVLSDHSGCGTYRNENLSRSEAEGK